MDKGKMERGVVELVDTESLVPQEHLLQKVDKAVDFRKLYEIVEPLYSEKDGRASVDPVVLFKIVLLQHLDGIPSLRGTLRRAQADIAYRWFLGYTLNEELPHFSTVSYNFRHGRLTREEFEVMKTHTTRGRELLEQILPLRQSEAFPLACDVCRHHHERWDGSGYPDHLAGYDIAPWVQVVGLADAFDALRQPRVYKPAFPLGQAFEMIVSGACGAFNPDLLACFSRNVDFIYYMAYVRTKKQQP